MKNKLLLAAVLFATAASAQETVHRFNSADYSALKAAGQLPHAGKIIEIMEPLRDSTPVLEPSERSTGCGCYIDPDATYTLAMGPNDDGSTGLISIPFNFCLYGTNYNSLYINNNGNVSFGTPYATFSASGFPSASFVMVAPFWGDVDTRAAGGGQVVYKIYPHSIYINWVGVGYYSMQTDKLNTFQLVLSDGSDTTIGVGNNVAFCYKDMQWTTGAASSGVGGFGGVPATVGANKGDGTSYIQFGRFDHAGTDYDGPVGASDGISWLDFQSFKFSTCVTTSNVQPVFVDFSPDLANTSYDCGVTGDTVKVCATGDTLVFSASVLDPNISDIVTLTMSTTAPSGATIISNTPGNPATISWYYVASPSDYGFNSFTVTATDNGTPILSTTAGFTIFVDTTGIGSFSTSITGDTILCAGETTVLSVPSTFDEYDWSSGSATNTSGPIGPGTAFVTLVKNGCYKSFVQNVIQDIPQPPIYGMYSLCGSPTSTLSTDDVYTTYNWNFNGANVSSVDSVVVNTTGTLILTVTDTNGCTGDSTVNITVSPSVNISGLTSACSGVTVDLTATASEPGSFAWSNGDTDNATSVTTTGDYIVFFTSMSGCVISDTQNVNFITTPNIDISASDTLACAGTPIILSLTGSTAGGTIFWSTTQSTPTIAVSSTGTYWVTVNNAGCSDNDTISVSFVPAPTVTITGPNEWCSNETHSIVASGSSPTGTYLWSTGATSTSISPTASGTYNVVFTDNNGCTGAFSYTITVDPTPNASFSATPPSPYVPTDLPVSVVFTNTSTIASPGVIVSNAWSVNDTTAGISTDLDHEFHSYGVNTIELIVVSDHGCIDSAFMDYEIAPVLMMPNIFTPNGQGGNNTLTIKNLEYYAPVTLNIQNRWGNPILSTGSYDNKWDGTKDGKDVAEGVYYYELVIKTGKVYTGYIHITR